ncbi:MAG: hypothetical protein J0M37_02435 [Ignavibacteria bacterium]|nr:hypothetical protein [Ignavibacteria bacterium]
MNSNNSGNKNNTKIKRRNFFVYLGAGAVAAAAITKLPFKLFGKKLKAEASIKVKPNPYAVKRDMSRSPKGEVRG